LSFVESGRATPSRDMIMRLAEHLAIPLRERNALLVAAGFAPLVSERRLDDPALAAARGAVDLILKGNEPHPAIAIDRHWTLVAANGAAKPFLAGVDAALLAPPVNVLRLSLHPKGMAPRIVNVREWRAHIFGRLARQIDNSGDPVLSALLDELKAYPVPAGAKPFVPPQAELYGGIAVPLVLAAETGTLSFLSTTTVFGTALDISLSELAIESFFPADAATAAAVRRLAAAPE
jgi:hypothetical protein